MFVEFVFANCSTQRFSLQGRCSLFFQNYVPWIEKRGTFAGVNYGETLRIFVTVVKYKMAVGRLVTSTQTRETPTHFLSYPV